MQLAYLCLLTLLACLPAARLAALELTLDEAMQRAGELSPDLAASRARVAAADARIDESRALLATNPYFSVSMFDSNDKRFVNNLEEGIAPSLSFSLSQTFELAGQRGKRIELAQNNRAVAEAGAAAAQQSVAQTVKQAFYGAIIARERSRSAYELVHWQREMDAAYEDSKRSLRNDSRMRIARAETNYAAEQANLFEQQTELRRLTGISADEDLVLVGELPEEIETLPPLEQLLAFARTRRVDLEAHRSSLASGESYASLIRRSAVPSVTLSGFLTRSDDVNNDDLQYGASLSFPLPVFQTGAAEVRAAIADRERASAELASAESLAEQQVRVARFACANAARDLVRVRDEILPRARENLALQDAAFDRDEGGLWELVSSEIDLVYARREFLSAQRAYVLALLELERSIGGSLAEVSSLPAEGEQP